MTDVYPPFRLDMGPTEPDVGIRATESPQFRPEHPWVRAAPAALTGI